MHHWKGRVTTVEGNKITIDGSPENRRIKDKTGEMVDVPGGAWKNEGMPKVGELVRVVFKKGV